MLESFRARTAELGLTDRTDTLPGDVHQLAIPRAFDLVVVANDGRHTSGRVTELIDAKLLPASAVPTFAQLALMILER